MNNERAMIPWHEIDTVFLDLDGTLLDLHFDNHFWLEHVPQRYAEKNGMSLSWAKAELMKRYLAIEGSLQWYCLDHWGQELNLDIVQLKREMKHLIAIRPAVVAFLDALRAAGKRVVLATNAHRGTLVLKMEVTQLEGHFDVMHSAHDDGTPKEQAEFWQQMQIKEPFDPARSLLIDDNEHVLRAAQEYGLKHLLGIKRPDSKGVDKQLVDFVMLESFEDLLPVESVPYNIE